MDVWGWVNGFRKRAQEEGDEPRLRLTVIHPAAYRLRETDPARALALFEEGRRLALALNEPWWVLFFDHWSATARMHFQRDYRDVLDLVVRSALEVRKPACEHHPLRLSIFFDVVFAYLGIDPLGHADAIRQALDQLDPLCEANTEDRYQFFAGHRIYCIEAKQLDAAANWAMTSLAMAASDPNQHQARHWSVFTYQGLCEIALERADWDELDRQSKAGEEVARRVGHQVELSEFLTYRGLVAWKQGDTKEARRQVQTALARFSRLNMPPKPSGFDALASFYEWEGDLRAVLAVRDRELALLTDKGRTAYETKVRTKRCRLLALLGERAALEQEVTAARAVASRLGKPATPLAELDAIAGGSGKEN